MPGIGIGISLILEETDPDGSYCSSCGELIVTKVHKLYFSIDSSLSVTGFILEPTNKQFCTACKPDL